MAAESIDLGICYSPIMAIELNPRVFWEGLRKQAECVPAFMLSTSR
jgi:hypothetical protein